MYCSYMISKLDPIFSQNALVMNCAFNTVNKGKVGGRNASVW